MNIQFGEAGLTSCDREPIHLPGSIQPHGVLLAIDRQTLAIQQFAGDTMALLGVAPEQLANASLLALFSAETVAPVIERLRGAAPMIAPSLLLELTPLTHNMPLDVTFHANATTGIIELEPAVCDLATRRDRPALVKSMLAALQAAKTCVEHCQAAAEQIRGLTGFDRVMVYRFLPDGSGKVIAETKTDALASYLGLHYPASDIPKQARELYRRSPLRLIPDVGYQPAPLQAAISPPPGALDLSDSHLRSVSPVHIEYLQNMGAGASMSVSIVLNGALWGLFACHNLTPRNVPAPSRIICELFAQVFALQLESRLEADTAQRRIATHVIFEALATRLAPSRNLAAELVGFKPGLLELIPAGGVVVSLEGQVHTLGQTPPAAFIAELMDWLKTQSQPLIESHELSAVFPAAAAHTATASGMLSISLSREPVDYVVWFRPELAHTITWAGMPGKPVQSGHLPPRKSFAAFPQQIKRKSAPWDTIDIEAARTLRVWLLETVLRQIDIARQEREAAFAHQALLMAELDHRVKNTLANIQGLVRQTKVGATSLDNYTLALERRIRAMAHAHSLIAETRWHGAPLGSLVKTELAPYRRRNKNQFNITGANVVLSPQAALPVTLVLHELTSNAAKYGALSSEHGCIDIAWHLDGENLVLTWRERNGPAVQPPQRRGFGSVIIERSLRHEIQGHSVLTFDPAGVTCTITFPAKYIVPHNNKEAQSV